MQTTQDEWAVSPLNPTGTVSEVNTSTILKKAVLVCARVFAAFGVFLVGWSVFDPHLPALTFLDPRALILAAILVAAGVVDRAKGVVPTEITYPLMLAGIARAIVVGDPSFLLYWFALAGIYLLNVIGGGDVKLLMGMFGLWPHLEFFIAMEIVVIATHLPIVLYRRFRHTDARTQLRTAWIWLQVRALEVMLGGTTAPKLISTAIAERPTEEELARHGDRLAIIFALAGIVYLILMTPVGLNWNFKI